MRKDMEAKQLIADEAIQKYKEMQKVEAIRKAAEAEQQKAAEASSSAR